MYKKEEICIYDKGVILAIPGQNDSKSFLEYEINVLFAYSKDYEGFHADLSM